MEVETLNTECLPYPLRIDIEHQWGTESHRLLHHRKKKVLQQEQIPNTVKRGKLPKNQFDDTQAMLGGGGQTAYRGGGRRGGAPGGKPGDSKAHEKKGIPN